MDTDNDSNFVGGFADSLRQIGVDPDPSRADSLHVSDCAPQPEFDAATSIATHGRISISEGLQAASSEGKLQPDNRNGCERYNNSDDNECFLGFNKKGNDLYMKHCKLLKAYCRK